jgi:hypothetical protein
MSIEMYHLNQNASAIKKPLMKAVSSRFSFVNQHFTRNCSGDRDRHTRPVQMERTCCSCVLFAVLTLECIRRTESTSDLKFEFHGCITSPLFPCKEFISCLACRNMSLNDFRRRIALHKWKSSVSLPLNCKVCCVGLSSQRASGDDCG